MNDDQFDDLKQFISTTVGQAESRIKIELKAEIIGEVTSGIRAEIQELRQEMRDGFAAIGAPIDSRNDTVDNHETRLTNSNLKPPNREQSFDGYRWAIVA